MDSTPHHALHFNDCRLRVIHRKYALRFVPVYLNQVHAIGSPGSEKKVHRLDGYDLVLSVGAALFVHVRDLARHVTLPTGYVENLKLCTSAG